MTRLEKALELIGTFTRTYGTRTDGAYSFHWDVSVNEGADFDSAAALLAAGNGADYLPSDMTELERAATMARVRADWDADSQWRWIVETMCEGVTGPYAADTYRTISPATAQAWNVSDSLAFDLEFSFEGRGGKHLVLTSFESVSLRDVAADEIWPTTDDEDTPYSEEWIIRLAVFLTEAKRMFSSAAVRAEFEYQLTFQLASAITSALPETRAVRQGRSERGLAHRRQ